MSNDVIARLAAANPVPTGKPLHPYEPVLRGRQAHVAVAVTVVLAVAIPAAAFAGKLGELLGISNGGTTVSTSSVLPGETNLDAAMQQLKVSGTMQSLGTLNGVAFYATRNAAGDFCLAIDSPTGKGFGCDQTADNFPTPTAQAFTFPVFTHLRGVAADGVATVQALDDNGEVIDSTPVVDNLFASTKNLEIGAAATIRTLDNTGHVTATRELP
jgi:hypothetical protein